MKWPGHDHIRNLSIATAAAIPYFGGVLAYILDKVLPETVVTRYELFIQSLEEDMNTLQRNTKVDKFETPQFYSLFVKVLNEVVDDHTGNKHLIYKNILLNTLDDLPSGNKSDFFFKITKSLTVDALNYLYAVFQDGEGMFAFGIMMSS